MSSSTDLDDYLNDKELVWSVEVSVDKDDCEYDSIGSKVELYVLKEIFHTPLKIKR